MISIRILKICDESIFIPPGILFWSCSQNGELSSECIKVSMVPVSISPLFYCLFQAKHWKGCCMAVCLNFSLRIVYYQKTNQALNQVTLVPNSFCQLSIKSTKLLIVVRSLIRVVRHLQKLWIRFDTRVLFSN